MIPKAKQLLNNRKGKVITALATAFVLLLTTLFGYTAYASGEKSINLVQNGKHINLTTRTDTVAELLKERGIHVDKHHDTIQPSLSADLKNGLTVKWDEAHKVTIKQNGKTKDLWTTNKTVSELLDKQGIKLGSHDAVSPSTNEKIDDNMSITIERGIQVNFANGTNTKTIWTIPMSVGEFLKQQHVTLGNNDRVEPSKSEQLKAGSKVAVIRIEKINDVKQEALDYKTIRENDSSLAKGETRVIHSGKEGQVAKTYEVTYENGKEVKRDLIKTEVQIQPQNKVVAVGIKVVQQTAYRGSRSFSGNEKVLYMRSTAYTAGCRGCSGTTTTGINLRSHPDARVIAVDPSVIPLGSKVYVEGYGYAIAADTGSAIIGNRIDVFFPNYSQTANWGVRTVKVKILN